MFQGVPLLNVVQVVGVAKQGDGDEDEEEHRRHPGNDEEHAVGLRVRHGIVVIHRLGGVGRRIWHCPLQRVIAEYCVALMREELEIHPLALTCTHFKIEYGGTCVHIVAIEIICFSEVRDVGGRARWVWRK